MLQPDCYLWAKNFKGTNPQHLKRFAKDMTEHLEKTNLPLILDLHNAGDHIAKICLSRPMIEAAQ